MECVFDFFGENVFAAFGNNEVLCAAGKVQIVFGIEFPQIARFKPAVGSKHLGGFFFHFVVALHNHRAFNDNFAYAVFVRIEDFHFHVRMEKAADAFDFKVFFRIQRDNRRRFGKSVALNKIDAQFLIHAEYACRKGASAGNRNADCAYAGFFQHGFKHLFTRIDTRNFFDHIRNAHEHTDDTVYDKAFFFNAL